jgi:2-oxoglutarate ferredoxin oxidoreductase subunit beta
VFRDVTRPEFGAAMSAQIVEAQEKRGRGDLAALYRSNGTWTIG